MNKQNVLVAIAVALLVVVIGFQSYQLYQVNKRMERLEMQPVVRVQRHQPALAQPKPQSNIGASQDASNSFTDLMNDWITIGFDNWNPWSEMEEFEKRMNTMQQRMREAFNANFGSNPSQMTRMNIQVENKGDHFEAEIKMPGIESSSISVNIENQRLLKVSGIKNQVIEEKGEGKNKQTNAISKRDISQHFVRSMLLPEPVDFGKVKFTVEKDSLKVVLPKMQKNS